jgi:hypothetical protein
MLSEITIFANFQRTHRWDMSALDRWRAEAEQTCTRASEWAELARLYESQGRPTAAASCRARANHYQEEIIHEPNGNDLPVLVGA